MLTVFLKRRLSILERCSKCSVIGMAYHKLPSLRICQKRSASADIPVLNWMNGPPDLMN